MNPTKATAEDLRYATWRARAARTARFHGGPRALSWRRWRNSIS